MKGIAVYFKGIDLSKRSLQGQFHRTGTGPGPDVVETASAEGANFDKATLRTSCLVMGALPRKKAPSGRPWTGRCQERASSFSIIMTARASSPLSVKSAAVPRRILRRHKRGCSRWRPLHSPGRLHRDCGRGLPAIHGRRSGRRPWRAGVQRDERFLPAMAADDEDVVP